MTIMLLVVILYQQGRRLSSTGREVLLKRERTVSKSSTSTIAGEVRPIGLCVWVLHGVIIVSESGSSDADNRAVIATTSFTL